MAMTAEAPPAICEYHRVNRFPFLQHDGVLAFAHRGGDFEGQENSMAAFEHAVRLGYRYLETDVHATADGVVVAFHDHTLDRVTDMTGRIAEQPWSVVSRARIGGTEPIVKLDELIAAWPDVRINLDVKEDAAVSPFVEAVRRVGALDRICVASFSDRRLRRVRVALGDRVCTSMGPAEIARLRLASYAPLRRAPTPRSAGCVQVPVQAYGLPIVTRRFVDAAHAVGLQVHVWTVNTRTEMERLLEIGVDGLMSDELETLRAVLTDRGTWVPHADRP